MIELAAGQSLQGSADIPGAVTYTVTGEQIRHGSSVYQILAQGQLPSTPAPLYTVPQIDGVLMSHILLANTSAGARAVAMYLNGTGVANQMASLTIPANGSATFDTSGWRVMDSTGAVVGTGTQGPQGPQGAAGSGTGLGYFVAAALTSTAIQAQIALAAAAGGGIVYCPPGVYSITATVVLADRVTLKGAGQTMVNGTQPAAVTTLRMAAGANLDAVVSESAWYASTAGEGVDQGIMDLCIDGNRANQTSGLGHGFASSGWRSFAIGCDIIHCRGSGILVSNLQRNGVAFTTATLVENRFMRCNIDDTVSHGFAVFEKNPGATGKITDGFLQECLISNCGAGGASDGINMQQAGGWAIHHNHTYNTGRHGFWTQSAQTTRIHDNYFEGYGLGPSNGACAGIYVVLSEDATIHDNRVYWYNPGAGSTGTGIYVDNSWAGPGAGVQIQNNLMWAQGGYTGTTALNVVNSLGASAFYVVRGSNLALGTWTNNFTSTGTLTTSGANFV